MCTQSPRHFIAAYNLVHATGTQNDKKKKGEQRRYMCRMRYPMAHRYIPCKQCSRHDWCGHATAVVATGYTRFSQHNDSLPERFKYERSARPWTVLEFFVELEFSFSHESTAVEKRDYRAAYKSTNSRNNFIFCFFFYISLIAKIIWKKFVGL